MKAIMTSVLALAMTAGLMAQDDLQAKYDEKLKKKFVSHIKWSKTLEDAKKLAAKEKKLIVGYFTRSYAP